VARYSLEFKRSVAKDVAAIPKRDLQRIMERIEALRDDPRPPGCVKLSGQEYYRIRQGNHRIVYEIIDDRLVVVVIAVGHRRETDR
jgi:mRNA interferase RelE/StbE